MRKTILLSVALGLALGAAGAAPARGEEIQVVVGGRYHEPLTGYQAGGRTFINAKQAGDLYGGQVYWYPLSGRIQLSFRGQRLQFLVGSEEASLDGRTVALDAPVMLRAAQAYVPLTFFLGDEFAACSGMESQFNGRTRQLAVERRSSVGSVRWFSYQDYTRVVLELKRPLGHNASARGVRGVDVTVPFGIIEGAEQVQVGDGLVAGYALRQEAKVARLSVQFARSGLKWRVRELAEPRRLALEVAAVDPEDVVPPGASEPAETPAPGAPTAAPAAGATPPASAVVQSPQAVEPAVVPPELEVKETTSAAAPAAAAAPAVPATVPAGVAAAVPAVGLVRRLIVIDAGHGGKDSGATGRHGSVEKDINLAAAKELAKILQEEQTFKVVLTRTDDTFVPLADRSELANQGHADLFISLHCNAHRKSKENGFEVYFLSEKASDPEAERLAEFENSSLELEGKSPSDEQANLILRAMSKTENINSAAELAALVSRSLQKRVDLTPRGVKQAAFYVLRGTDAPAILVEMAFVSNSRDEAKLQTRRYRSRLVEGIYAGLADYAQRQGWLKPGRSRSLR